jgi:fatty acid desaturase
VEDTSVSGNDQVRLGDFLGRSRSLGYAQVFGNVGVFLLLCWFASMAHSWWQYVLLFVAIGFAQHRLFFPVHDCLHYSLFPSRQENRFFGSLIAALIGTSFDAIRVQHMDHHRDFGKATDPGAADYFVKFSSRRELTWFLLSPLLGGIFLSKIGDYVQRIWRSAGKETGLQPPTNRMRQPILDYCLVLGAQIAICGLLSGGFQWNALWRYPIFYILPLVTVFLFLVRLRMFLEHGSLNYEICDYFEGRRPTARTIYASPVEQLLLCGSNFNYHHEHHRFPVISGWQLPRLHQRLAVNSQEDVRQTYAQALTEIWCNLR